MIEIFRDSPLLIQVALGAGYLGYISAYAGIRQHHKQIDIAFMTLSFGLIATAVLLIAASYLPVLAALPVTCVLTVAAGIIWRKFGRETIYKGLRLGGVSYADEDPTVFTRVAADTKHHVSQVTVNMTDGREYRCDDTGKFRDAAIAPFIYGTDGSVAMYVTHSYRPGLDGSSVETARENTRDDYWGDAMTIIPAANIRSLEIRFQRK